MEQQKTPAESKIDFGIRPEDHSITKWDESSPINRLNLTDWLIKSFRISEGSPRRQFIFMMWTKIRLGFDFESEIKDLINSGGWFALTNFEQKKFQAAFSGISSKDHKPTAGFYTDPKEGFELQLSSLITIGKGDNIKAYDRFLGKNADFEQIGSVEELRQRLEREIPKREG